MIPTTPTKRNRELVWASRGFRTSYRTICNVNFKILVPERKPRNGLIGLRPSETPGELLARTVSLLRREAHLRELAHRPDRYLFNVRNADETLRDDA